MKYNDMIYRSNLIYVLRQVRGLRKMWDTTESLRKGKGLLENEKRRTKNNSK